MYIHPRKGATAVMTITLVEAIPPITTWRAPSFSATRKSFWASSRFSRSKGTMLVRAVAERLRNVAQTRPSEMTRKNMSARKGPVPSIRRATVAIDRPPSRVAM
jgi:hypothetical protein